MLATVEQRAKNSVKEFRADIDQLEDYVRQWEQEFQLREIGKASQKCTTAFNSLQMSLSKLVDKAFHDELQLDCYKYTKEFLSYFESEINEDFVVLLFNNCQPFSKLFILCSDYCSKIEREHNIELDSEKAVRTNEKLVQHLKSLRQS